MTKKLTNSEAKKLKKIMMNERKRINKALKKLGHYK